MPRRRGPKTPTEKQLREAFGERIFKPVGKHVVTGRGPGWGSSGDSIDHLSLRFELGATKEPVIVQVTSNPWHGSVSNVLIHLFFELDHGMRPRFPLVIERGKQPIRVDGCEHEFTTYTTGPAAVATGTVDGLTVMVRCRTRRLGKLELRPIEARELREALRPL